MFRDTLAMETAGAQLDYFQQTSSRSVRFSAPHWRGNGIGRGINRAIGQPVCSTRMSTSRV